jgi:hypothetical protein
LKHKNPIFQLEAAEFFSQISKKFPKLVMDSGAIPSLLMLVESSKDEETKNHCIKTFINVSSKSTRNRDYLLNADLMEKLISQFSKSSELEFIK